MKLHALTVPAGVLSFGLLAAAGLISLRVTAGPLNPPSGTVSSTYKTLTEVEPRIAINSTNTPGDGDSVYKITAPGSYYLTGNVALPTTKAIGIEIVSVSADQVSIDLNGYELRGSGATTLIGISSTVGSRVWVCNGSLRDFKQSGVVAEGNSVMLEKLQVVNCGTPAIHAEGSGTIRDCTVADGPGTGFSVTGAFTIERCSATLVGGYGFLTAGECVLADCTALQCSSGGVYTGDNTMVRGSRAVGNLGLGIHVGAGCDVIDSESTGNVTGIEGDDSTRCVNVLARGNQSGFVMQDSCVLRGCTAYGNSGAGVLAGADLTAIDCVSSQNVTASGDGFKAAGANASFVDCKAIGNGGDGFDTTDGSTFTGCASNDNTGRGFAANNGARVENCTTRNNQQDGISVNYSCAVIGNNCSGDGAAGGTHGAIKVVGQANRIEGNNISYADRGLYLTSGGNVVFRNSVKGCIVNFDIVGGNDVGPIGSASMATSPWANIQY
ncbi:MAG: hypothetical protein U0638_11345 [Phycisphaerales bacterium]